MSTSTVTWIFTLPMTPLPISSGPIRVMARFWKQRRFAESGSTTLETLMAVWESTWVTSIWTVCRTCLSLTSKTNNSRYTKTSVIHSSNMSVQPVGYSVFKVFMSAGARHLWTQTETEMKICLSLMAMLNSTPQMQRSRNGLLLWKTSTGDLPRSTKA